jgi:hypothetical protein
MNAVGLAAIAELSALRRATASTATRTATPATTSATEAASSTTAASPPKSATTSTAGSTSTWPTAAESGGILRLRAELNVSTAEKLLAGTGVGLRIR